VVRLRWQDFKAPRRRPASLSAKQDQAASGAQGHPGRGKMSSMATAEFAYPRFRLPSGPFCTKSPYAPKTPVLRISSIRSPHKTSGGKNAAFRNRQSRAGHPVAVGGRFREGEQKMNWVRHPVHASPGPTVAYALGAISACWATKPRYRANNPSSENTQTRPHTARKSANGGPC